MRERLESLETMDFASSSSAGPSGSSSSFDYFPEPSTSRTSTLNRNVALPKWRMPAHLAAIVNDSEHSEKTRYFIYNRTDPNIQCDMRAFYNCMEYEEMLKPNYEYFTAVQNELTPYHREQAIDWIYDVAKEENCDGDVFLLAVALIDRFLSLQCILKHDIQMVAGVALFIASKLKAPHPLTAFKISYYSDNSLSIPMILQWELVMITALDWETESPTAFSFFDFLASSYPQIHGMRSEFQYVVHKCQKMHRLATLFPSMQCAIVLYYVSHIRHHLHLAEDIKALMVNMFQLEINLLDPYIPLVKRCLAPAPIYAVEPEQPAPAPIAPIAPIAMQEEDIDGDDEQEDDEEEEVEMVVSPKEKEPEGTLTPPNEEEPHQVQVFAQVPECDQSPITPLNDSGFSSDFSSPSNSAEKKRRRSSDWFEDEDYTPPKIFKFK
ncbi:unnamed protein product [Caenorhabditis nigoni]